MSPSSKASSLWSRERDICPLKVTVCQPLPNPNPLGEQHQLLHKVSMGLMRPSQLYSKLGLHGEQAGKATVSTDRMNGTCGHSSGVLRDYMERGWGSLLCWPSSHIASTVGKLSLGASERCHSTAAAWWGWGASSMTCCLCPSTLDSPAGCLGNRGAAGLTKSTAVPCTDFFTNSRHPKWDRRGQKGPFLLSLASSSPRPEDIL